MLRCVLLYYSGALAVARIAPHALRERDLSCLVRAVRSRAAGLNRGQQPLVFATSGGCQAGRASVLPTRTRAQLGAIGEGVLGARGGPVR